MSRAQRIRRGVKTVKTSVKADAEAKVKSKARDEDKTEPSPRILAASRRRLLETCVALREMLVLVCENELT